MACCHTKHTCTRVQTSYEKGEKPTNGSFYGFDHVHWWVGNAKQAGKCG